MKSRLKIQRKGLTGFILFVLCLASMLVLPASAAFAQESSDNQSGQAVFAITNLRLEPAKAEVGQTVLVKIDVTNSGEAEGSYKVVLQVNGKAETSQDVTLAAGETRTAEFSYMPTIVGNYTIAIADKTAILTVIPVAEPKLREGPVVSLRPVCDIIDSSQDGLVELYFSNSSLNDVTMQGDFYVSVPAGIYVYGQGMGLATAAGTTYGQFSAAPGMAKTIYLNIKADETVVGRSFFIHFSGQYYIDGNKDSYQPISLTHPFKVVAASPQPEQSKPTDPKQVPNSEAGGIWIGWWIIGVVVVLGGIAVIVAAKSR
jgi:hypothetical protein